MYDGTTVRYWIEQNEEYPLYYHENGELKGIYADLIGRIGRETGAHTVLVSERDGESLSTGDALDMLGCGELDLVLGLTQGMSDDGRLCTSACIYDNTLTAVILPDSPQLPSGNIANCYWAVDSAMLGLLEGSDFEGHTPDYRNRTQMYEALREGSVYGALVKRSTLDYEAYVGHNFEFRECAGISLPYGECVYMNTANAGLNEAVLAACDELAHKESTPGIAEYTNLLADAYASNARMNAAAYGGIACAIVLGVICAVLAVRLKRHRNREEAKMRTIFAEAPEKELFELDLRTRRLYAYRDFAIFGAPKDAVPNPVSLDDLSTILGYDMTGHFAGVREGGNTIYKNRLIIFIGGVKHYYTEEGRRVGSRLIFTMTELNPGSI